MVRAAALADVFSQHSGGAPRCRGGMGQFPSTVARRICPCRQKEACDIPRLLARLKYEESRVLKNLRKAEEHSAAATMSLLNAAAGILRAMEACGRRRIFFAAPAT